MLKLKNVTLVCIDGIGNTGPALEAIQASTYHIQYEKVIFITADVNIKSNDINIKSNNNLEIKNINKMSWNDYQKFLLKDLTNYFETEHVLSIHDDGYVSNHLKWIDEFYEYDYIGAPWPIFITKRLLANLSNQLDYLRIPFETNIPVLKNYNIDNYRVGNSGFSLKSKKLCEFTKNYADKYPGKPDDNIICVYEKEDITNNGLKIAPIEIAAKFSVETANEFNPSRDIQETFGFHRFNG